MFWNSSNTQMELEIQSRQSIFSVIDEIRHDYKCKYVPFGEFIDNSFDWGKANNIKIILKKNKIIIIDNGNGISSERLKTTLILGNKNKGVKRGTIGKFGLGLKKGGIILGNKITVLTHNSNNYEYTEADWEEMTYKNSAITNYNQMNEHQIKMFNDYIQTIPNNKGKGTIVIIENLERSYRINKTFYENLCSYVQQLYVNMETKKYIIEIILNTKKYQQNKTITKSHDPCLRVNFYNTDRKEDGLDEFTIIIYNKNDSAHSDDESDCDTKRISLIEWNGIKYKCDNIKPTNLIKTDKLKLLKSKQVKGSKLDIFNNEHNEFCRLNICATYFEINDMEIEKQLFPKISWEKRVGVYFNREGRYLSGFEGKKLILSSLTQKSMYRGKGIRIVIDFPSNIIDREMGVTSLKMINEESFANMPNFISFPIASILYTCNKRHEDKCVKNKEKAQALIDKKIEIAQIAINESNYNTVEEIKIWLEDILKNNIVKEYSFDIGGRNKSFKKIEPFLNDIDDFMENFERIESIKNNHKLFCEEHLIKLVSLDNASHIKNMINNYNKEFQQFDFLSDDFTKQCETKIYDLKKKLRLKKYYNDYYKLSELDSLKELYKKIQAEQDTTLFDEILQKVKEKIDSIPPTPPPRPRTPTPRPRTPTPRPRTPTPPPRPRPPIIKKQYYNECKDILEKLNNLFKNNTNICTKNIHDKLKNFHDDLS